MAFENISFGKSSDKKSTFGSMWGSSGAEQKSEETEDDIISAIEKNGADNFNDDLPPILRQQLENQVEIATPSAAQSEPAPIDDAADIASH